VQRRAFKTRTGHALEFLEGRTNKGIWLKSGDDKVRLEMDCGANPAAVTLHSDGTVLVEANRDVKIQSKQGGIQVVSAQKIEMTARTGVTIDAGGGNVEVKGVNVDLKGTAQAKLSAANVTVEGQANTQVKGGALVQVQAALVKIN
jgi:hypothetical protein